MCSSFELIAEACCFVENVLCGVQGDCIHEVLYHSSNVDVLIRTLALVRHDLSWSVQHAISALIMERIVPLGKSLAKSDHPTRLGSIYIKLAQFTTVATEKVDWHPDTYKSIMKFAFILNRANLASLRVCGIELATVICNRHPGNPSIAYHISRFVELWRKSNRYDDVASRLAQLRFVSSILRSANLLPRFCATSIIHLHILVEQGVKSNIKSIATSSEATLRIFDDCFPQFSHRLGHPKTRKGPI